MSDTSKFGFSPEMLSLPNQQEYDGATFPLALGPEAGSLGEARDWIAEKAGQIEGQAAAHGAVLLRGLPLATPEDFDAAVAAFRSTQLHLRGFPLQCGAQSLYPARVLRERGASRNHHFSTPRNGSDPGLSEQALFLLPKSGRRGRLHPLCRSGVLWERIEKEYPSSAKIV